MPDDVDAAEAADTDDTFTEEPEQKLRLLYTVLHYPMELRAYVDQTNQGIRLFVAEVSGEPEVEFELESKAFHTLMAMGNSDTLRLISQALDGGRMVMGGDIPSIAESLAIAIGGSPDIDLDDLDMRPAKPDVEPS